MGRSRDLDPSRSWNSWNFELELVNLENRRNLEVIGRERARMRARAKKKFSACGATPEMRRRREFFGSKQCIKKYSWLPMDIDYSSAVLCETIA